MRNGTLDLTPLYSPKKDPMRLALFMSGTGSNVKKILDTYIEQRSSGDVSFEPVFLFTDNMESNASTIQEEYKEKGIDINLFCNPIQSYYKKANEREHALSDMDVRANYDVVQSEALKLFSVDAVCLAGYDWVVTPVICENFVTVNVHPGDLRVRGSNGRPKYRGLGWIPSAKAILAGENEVYTSVHLVTPDLDCGPLMGISEPQPLSREILDLDDRVAALGGGNIIKEIKAFMDGYNAIMDQVKPLVNGPLAAAQQRGTELPDLDQITAEKYPLYGYAKDCQERLKVHGDWVIFPKVIDSLARGKYAKDGKGSLYFDGVQIPNGWQFGVGE